MILVIRWTKQSRKKLLTWSYDTSFIEIFRKKVRFLKDCYEKLLKIGAREVIKLLLVPQGLILWMYLFSSVPICMVFAFQTFHSNFKVTILHTIPITPMLKYLFTVFLFSQFRAISEISENKVPVKLNEFTVQPDSHCSLKYQECCQICCQLFFYTKQLKYNYNVPSNPARFTLFPSYQECCQGCLNGYTVGASITVLTALTRMSPFLKYSHTCLVPDSLQGSSPAHWASGRQSVGEPLPHSMQQ